MTFGRAVGKLSGAQTAQEIVAAVSGKVIAVTKLILTASAATTMVIKDGDTTGMTATHEMVAGVPLTLDYRKSKVRPTTGAGKNVNITTSAGNIAYEIEYNVEP